MRETGIYQYWLDTKIQLDVCEKLEERHHPAFREMRAEAGRSLPDYIGHEFDAYLKCSRLEERFLCVRCETCHADKLVAFSCKKRGFCPSCGARRMAETAALRFLLARNPAALTRVLGVAYRAISGHLLKRAGLTRARGHTGAVTLIQRFGSALNLNIHFHMLFMDGVYLIEETGQTVSRNVPQPGLQDLQILVEHIAERSRLHNWKIRPHRPAALLQWLLSERGAGDTAPSPLPRAGRAAFPQPADARCPAPASAARGQARAAGPGMSGAVRCPLALRSSTDISS